MKADTLSTDPVSIPGMVSVKATELSAPPAWALMERNLISLMEEAAPMLLKKYAEPGGALYFADDLDDLYERIYNWGFSTPWAEMNAYSKWHYSAGTHRPV